MALLQVRDFPTELYTLLGTVAEEQKRSITQQTIFMLEEQLTQQRQSDKKRRQQVLASLNNLHLALPKDAPSPVDLVRADRDRPITLFDTNEERLR